MVSFLIRFVSILIPVFSQLYVCSIFFREKINFKKIIFYVVLFVISILSLLNYFYINVFIRMIILSFLFSIGNWLIFRKKLSHIIVGTLYSQFLLSVTDVIGVLLLILFLGKDSNFIKTDFFDTFFADFYVSIIFLFICSRKIIRKIYDKLILCTDSMKMSTLLKFCILIIISINFFMAVNYYDIKSIYIIIINLSLLLVYSFILYKTINQRNLNMIVTSENQSLLKNLHQYEDMVDRQRVDNHENKNQLLIIKNMIKKKDKDVVKYIDTIVKDQKEDDETLYTRVMTIPSGGLQGIIYQKMLVMKDEHIKFSLDVGRGVRDFELDKLSMDDNYRLCKIVGVFLDNAIEESRKIDDKCIMISLYVDDDNLVIEVSNRFEGKIDIDKLDESGYTTKGDGHGYGLSLVKKILSETDKFENIRSINRNVFKQIIKIKNT